MKLINSNSEIIEQKDIFKHIELCSRVCYKSENNITDVSANNFIQKLINSGHHSMLEHGTVYLQYKAPEQSNPLAKYINNKYSKVNIVKDQFVLNNIKDVLNGEEIKDIYNQVEKYNSNRQLNGDTYYVTTNYREIVKNNWYNDLEYVVELTQFHEKRVTVKFILSREVAQQFTRHRAFSFAMESQRFCNYSKSKFDNNITFVIPAYTTFTEGYYNINENSLSINDSIYDINEYNKIEKVILRNFSNTEKDYMELINMGLKPEEARAVLGNKVKTELAMTGFVSDWNEFFKLRCADNVDPEARAVAIPLYEKFKFNEILK